MTPDAFIAAFRRAGHRDEALLARVRLSPSLLARLTGRLGLGRDRNGAFRNAVALALFDDATLADRPLVRLLLEAECRYAEEHAYNECWHDTVLCLAHVLFRLGQVDDVALLVRAKACCFDLGVLLDGQLLCGAGVDATLRLLASDPALDFALEHVRAMQRGGELDDVAGHVRGWVERFRSEYELPPGDAGPAGVRRPE